MIEYSVYSLTEVLNQFGKVDILEEAFSAFKCSREEDLEVFLCNKCLKYEMAGNCRTFLILDKEQLIKHSKISIVAFFSTAITTLDISTVRKKLRQKVLGPAPLNKESMPVFLIGQLGRSDAYSKEQMPGEVVMGECLAAIERAKVVVGGRILLVECREHLLGYYNKYDFVEVTKDKGTLYQLYRKIS